MNKKKQLKVVYSDWGLANFFGEYVEINSKLKNNKVIRDYVVKHELGHIQGFDIQHEFDIDWKVMPLLIKFVAKNPKTWIDFLPVQYRKGALIWDFNLIVLYVGAIIMTVIGCKWLKIL